MDIVAESLSANVLKARNVTVRGQDVLKWFESKLSASVSFAGVFESLDDAPRRNGAVAIVGSKDYIYSSTTSAWQEFGDEGQIGTLAQAVAELQVGLSGYQPAGDYVSAESDPVFKSLSGNFLTAESDPVFKSLSGNFLTAESDPVFCKLSSNFLTAESDPVFRSLSSNFLTAEQAFASVSSTFLTSHQSLSEYCLKSEISSAEQIESRFTELSERIAALEQKLNEILGSNI